MSSLRQIRYFLTVADLGSFTQAASALFVAQPALSRQIAQLEQELGFTLFEREARGVRLTAAGALFRDRVGTVEKLLVSAAEESSRLARGEGGVLRLLHSSSVPTVSLMPAIKRFVEEAPNARIDLDRVSSEIQVTAIAGHKADIGIVRLPVLRRDPAVNFIELPAEALWVALPAAHPLAQRKRLALADLAEEAFVSAVHRERGGLARCVANLCLQRGFVPKLAPVISRKTSMLNLVAAGFGIAVVPERMTAISETGVVYRPLKDEDAVSTTALVLPLRPTPLAQRFADLVRSTASPENFNSARTKPLP
ncbi:MAG TPA: LysR substrate-binding domain-containing protein [Rhodocyclaceae bacterium]|nr:LysR substrate-binding domain-containing protein [Rhodocyclaceae bacterium]